MVEWPRHGVALAVAWAVAMADGAAAWVFKVPWPRAWVSYVGAMGGNGRRQGACMGGAAGAESRQTRTRQKVALQTVCPNMAKNPTLNRKKLLIRAHSTGHGTDPTVKVIAKLGSGPRCPKHGPSGDMEFDGRLSWTNRSQNRCSGSVTPGSYFHTIEWHRQRCAGTHPDRGGPKRQTETPRRDRKSDRPTNAAL